MGVHVPHGIEGGRENGGVASFRGDQQGVRIVFGLIEQLILEMASLVPGFLIPLFDEIIQDFLGIKTRFRGTAANDGKQENSAANDGKQEGDKA